MREIKVTIQPDGATKITTQGFTGTACKDATRAIEKALGANTGSSDAVKHILLNADGRPTPFESLDGWQRFLPPDVSVYHQIGGGL